METIAIIPLGPLTTPSIRKLLINNPGLPGGKFSGEPPLFISLPSSGEKGSRREIFSRTAIGRTTAPVDAGGTFALADATGFGLAGFAVVFAATLEEGLSPGAAAFVVLAVPAAGFTPDTALDAGGAAELLAGFVAEVAATEAGFAVEPVAGLAALGTDAVAGEAAPALAGFGAGVTGFATGAAGGAVFGAWALGVATPEEAGCFTGETLWG